MKHGNNLKPVADISDRDTDTVALQENAQREMKSKPGSLTKKRTEALRKAMPYLKGLGKR